MSRDISVGIATRYGLDGPGMESRWGARFSAPVHGSPGARLASYMMGNGSFPWVKRPGHGADHPPPSSAEVKEREELYLYFSSGPLRPVLGWILPELLLFAVEVSVKYFLYWMLQVSAFSTWEKELHKIVFDPRYLLLTSKERKQVFEKYVKERAEEERREKRNKMRERKDEFRRLMEEAGLHGKWVSSLWESCRNCEWVEMNQPTRYSNVSGLLLVV